MVTANSEMQRAQLVALVTLANTAATGGKLAHGPFVLFNPPSDVTDRGAWAAGTYNTGDQVTCDGYLFVSVINGNTSRPLDAITGNANAGWQQPWQSCYQRIRDEVQVASAVEAAGLDFPLTQWGLSVSGPWPCQAPDINYDMLAFYFEDTGSAENVTVAADIGASAHVGFTGKQSFSETELLVDIPGNHGWGLAPFNTTNVTVGTVETDTAVTGPPGQFRVRYISDVEITVVIGGANPIPINVTFTMGVGFSAGMTTREQANATNDGVEFPPDVYDTADPTGMISVDTTNWFPGATFTAAAFSGWAFPSPGVASSQGSVGFSCTVNATVNPGTYKVKFTSSGTPNNRASGAIVTDSSTGSISGFVEYACDTFAWFNSGLFIDGSMGIVYSPGVTVNGIDDTHAVKKILVSDFSGLGPPAMIGVHYQMNPPISQDLAFLTSVDNMVEIVESAPANTSPTSVAKPINISGNFVFTPSVPGYWAGVTPPITSLGMLPFDQMPWNKFPTTLPAIGANTATENKYLGYIKPYLGGKNFTGGGSTRAYDYPDAPAWMTAGSSAGELLPCLKRWRALVHYPAGFTIQDSYGNHQTLINQNARSGTMEPGWPGSLGDITNEPNYVDLLSHPQPGATWKLTKVLRDPPTIQRTAAYGIGATEVDDNGNVQTCTTAGSTGSSAPVWAATLTTTTIDGTVTWTLARVNPKFNPPVARISPPIYPFIWHNPVSLWEASKVYVTDDTITDSNGNIQAVITSGTSGAIEPAWSTSSTTNDGTAIWRIVRIDKPLLTDPNIDPFSGDHTFSFKPQGWFIYRVFLNRIPQTKSRVKPSTTPISVELGCVRGGVFVSFGTYNTGTPVDAMWPVFTNTALAYRCAERIDVQAEILTCGLGYATWGNVHFPMAAAFLNDIETIIGLL